MRPEQSLCAELAFSQLWQTFGFVFHPPPALSLEPIWMSENRDVENRIYATKQSGIDKGGWGGDRKAAFLCFLKFFC